MDQGELYGQWSADGQVTVEGRLRIDEADRCTLQLRSQLRPAARITGELVNGQTVTLLGAHETSRSFGEHFVQDLLIDTAVIGMELEGHDDACLTAATVRLAGLEQAIGVSGLSLTTSDSASKSSKFAQVEWEGSQPIEVSRDEGTLVLDSCVRFDHESWFRFALEHRAQAKLTAARPLSLGDVRHVFDRLATFVAFATDAQVGRQRLDIRGEDGAAEVLTRERPRYGPTPDAGEPWLNLAHLSDAAAALAGFYRFADEQPAAFVILFEYLIFASALNPSDKLLYLARFLEVYHRTRFPGKRDPEEVHAERVALVKEATKGDHKEWGAHILRRSNDVFFKERVRKLVTGPAAAAQPVLGGTPQEFAKVVGDSRNYWTHYSEELEAKALRDVELDEFDDRLLVVVRACVLDHMGLSPVEARACLERDWRWARRAAEPL
jgi:hypothetical protein